MIDFMDCLRGGWQKRDIEIIKDYVRRHGVEVEVEIFGETPDGRIEVLKTVRM